VCSSDLPKDTISLPLNITGELTPDNMDAVICGILEQITPQLREWGYKPGETVTIVDSTTGQEVTITVPATEDQPNDTICISNATTTPTALSAATASSTPGRIAGATAWCTTASTALRN
jgi:hypothetical protein